MAVQDLRFLDEQCLLVIKFSNIDHFFQNVLWEFILHHHLEILSMALCLSGRVAEACFVIAVVCSTWSSVNLATSKRDLLCPYGDQRVPSVRSGNRMVARLGGFHLNLNSSLYGFTS